MINEVKSLLSKLTGKKNIFITRRGNISIKDSLKFCKEKGFNRVYLQDQGGWITYHQFSQKLKFEIINIKTDYGIVEGKFEDGVLLINTMPAYAFLQETSKIIIGKNLIIINDVSGSIGTEEAKWGDIIIGSFGKDKPINLNKGGFIATNLSGFQNIIKEEQLTLDEVILLKSKIENLNSKLEKLYSQQIKLKEEMLSLGFSVVHPEYKGINVIVKIKNEQEKEKIIEYCINKGFEFTECPRYIRINEPAISIEVKKFIKD